MCLQFRSSCVCRSYQSICLKAYQKWYWVEASMLILRLLQRSCDNYFWSVCHFWINKVYQSTNHAVVTHMIFMVEEIHDTNVFRKSHELFCSDKEDILMTDYFQEAWTVHSEYYSKLLKERCLLKCFAV